MAVWSEVSSAALSRTRRFDAEYFSPRTQNLLAALSRDGLTLGDAAKLARQCLGIANVRSL